MRKPRVKNKAQLWTLDGGWVNKESFTQKQRIWFYTTPWCAVFALLVTVHHNCPEVALPSITSDDELRVLRETWKQHVTFSTHVLQNWPALDEDIVLSVLNQVYGLTCRTICEEFTCIPVAKLDEVRETQNLSALARYPEFWTTNAVGLIITTNGDGTEHHAIAFTTRGTECSVVFVDTLGHSRITQDWFQARGDSIVLEVYQVYKPFR